MIKLASVAPSDIIILFWSQSMNTNNRINQQIYKRIKDEFLIQNII